MGMAILSERAIDAEGRPVRTPNVPVAHITPNSWEYPNDSNPADNMSVMACHGLPQQLWDFDVEAASQLDGPGSMIKNKAVSECVMFSDDVYPMPLKSCDANDPNQFFYWVDGSIRYIKDGTTRCLMSTGKPVQMSVF